MRLDVQFIADITETKRFWTEIMRDENADMKDRLKASEFIVFIPIKFNQSTVMWNLHMAQRKTESIHDPSLLS